MRLDELLMQPSTLPSANALIEREKVVRRMPRRPHLPKEETCRVLVSPSLHGALVARLAYKLGYAGGRLCTWIAIPTRARCHGQRNGTCPKKVSYTPIRGDLLALFWRASGWRSGDSTVVLHGLLDYLPTRLLPDLAESLAAMLRPSGQALLVQLSPSEDSFFEHLIGWRTRHANQSRCSACWRVHPTLMSKLFGKARLEACCELQDCSSDAFLTRPPCEVGTGLNTLCCRTHPRLSEELCGRTVPKKAFWALPLSRFLLL